MITAKTPEATHHSQLSKLASRYVNVSELPWKSTPYSGVEIKVLLEDKKTGLLTAITRMQPGALLPLHVHHEIE